MNVKQTANWGRAGAVAGSIPPAGRTRRPMNLSPPGTRLRGPVRRASNEVIPSVHPMAAAINAMVPDSMAVDMVMGLPLSPIAPQLLVCLDLPFREQRTLVEMRRQVRVTQAAIQLSQLRQR